MKSPTIIATFICTQNASVRARKTSVIAGGLHGPREIVDELLAEGQREAEADEQGDQAAHDAHAQLAQVLHERHLVGDGCHAGYQRSTKWRRAPTPRPAWKPAAIAAVT